MGTHFKGTDEETRALNCYIKLMRAAVSTTARIHRHLGQEGLSVTQFGVLEVLYHLGPLSQREIGKKLLKSGGNVTLVIDNLEKRGLVRRERDLQDRRVIHVHLSDEGRQLINTIFPRHVKAVVQEMRSLEESEQKELDRLCRILGLGERRSTPSGTRALSP